MVGATGFEPATTCTPCRCATRLRYAPAISFRVGRAAATGRSCYQRDPYAASRGSRRGRGVRFEYSMKRTQERRGVVRIRRSGRRVRRRTPARELLVVRAEEREHGQALSTRCVALDEIGGCGGIEDAHPDEAREGEEP